MVVPRPAAGATPIADGRARRVYRSGESDVDAGTRVRRGRGAPCDCSTRCKMPDSLCPGTTVRLHIRASREQ